MNDDRARLHQPEVVTTTRKPKLPGAVHRLTPDLRKALLSEPKVKAAWEGLTPLSRNEWICWITSAKQAETKTKRTERAREDLAKGKRRPCCWPGCPHRRPSAKKWFSKRPS